MLRFISASAWSLFLWFAFQGVLCQVAVSSCPPRTTSMLVSKPSLGDRDARQRGISDRRVGVAYAVGSASHELWMVSRPAVQPTTPTVPTFASCPPAAIVTPGIWLPFLRLPGHP